MKASFQKMPTFEILVGAKHFNILQTLSQTFRIIMDFMG